MGETWWNMVKHGETIYQIWIDLGYLDLFRHMDWGSEHVSFPETLVECIGCVHHVLDHVLDEIILLVFRFSMVVSWKQDAVVTQI